VLRAANNDQVVELLPPLEVVVPASAVAELAARLDEYRRDRAEEAE
jgi:hypothetical protein